jgi:hypothetical protein
MRVSYPDTPLSEFRVVDTYVRTHGGVETLEDDEDDEDGEEVFKIRKKICRSESWVGLQGLTFHRIE